MSKDDAGRDDKQQRGLTVADIEKMKQDCSMYDAEGRRYDWWEVCDLAISALRSAEGEPKPTDVHALIEQG